MKQIVRYIAVGSLAISTLGSCKKDYLETAPTDQVDAGAAFKTTTNALASLNGIHRAMYVRYNSQGEYGQPAMMVNMDMLGEDLVMTELGNGWYNTTYRWIDHRNATGALPKYPYQFYYRLISNANLIIANIDGAVGPQSEKDMIKGQALAYRAWCHFNLVQLYGQRYRQGGGNSQPGVPLMLTPTKDGQPRASVEDIYTQVNKDLNDAMALLTASRPAKSHFNINIVKGVKARVALTQGDWANAAKFSAEAREGWQLMNGSELLDGFSSVNNKEWMWGLKQVEDQTTYFAAFHSYMSCNYNSTNIRTNPKAGNSLLYNAMSETDLRRAWFDPTGSAAAITPPGGIRRPFMNQKYRLNASTVTSSTPGDVPLMRTAEMYLIEAEAKARANDFAGAQDALYTLMISRDPSYVKSDKTGEDLIAEIMQNRRVELWGEGFRFLDLKRLNLPLNRNGANHKAALALIFDVPAGDKMWEFLIPQDEINANKLVEQNPL